MQLSIIMISILHDYGTTSSKLIFHGLVFEAAAETVYACQNRIFQFSDYFSYEVDAKQPAQLKY